MNDYIKQANDFLAKAKAEIKADYLKHDFYFAGDKDRRDIYKITIKREGVKPWRFNFGQSIANTGKVPTAYEVLSCITKYEPEDNLEDFCSSFGYDIEDKTSKKIYKAVQKEFSECNLMFSDVMDELQEIN